MNNKKASLVIMFLFAVTTIVIALSGADTTSELTGKAWKFKSVLSPNASTSHYVTTLYEGAQYEFAKDHTFSGSFFGKAVSGNWEIADNKLVLNKGTNHEEKYTFTMAADQTLTIEGMEKGDKVLISFRRD